MSYFLLPKHNIKNINIHFLLRDDAKRIITSTFYYYNKLHNEFEQLSNNNYAYNKLMKLMNPYEYICFSTPTSNLTVSKLKTKSLLFYDLVEIDNALKLFSSANANSPSNRILNISPKFEDFNYYIETMLETQYDITTVSNIDQTLENESNAYNFIYFEDSDSFNVEPKLYINNIIKIIFIIIKNLSKEGSCLIKIDNIFYTPVIEILYLLSAFFEKVYIIKPNTSNAGTFEKYIVCKNFSLYKINLTYEGQADEDIITYLTNTTQYVVSILNKEVPCYFTNKIYDLNTILVQQQLESMEQIINIFKAKNYKEKLDTLEKANIQKSILWCEKFKIPCNKFIDKTNIFLPILKTAQAEELVKES